MLFTLPIDPFAFFGGLWLLLLIIPIIICIIDLILAIWVFKDAKKRDMNAAVWLLIVLFFPCIGCIIYLVVRD